MSTEQLPDELLIYIFKFVDQRDSWNFFRDRAQMLTLAAACLLLQHSLCLVNRRFHRIATPLLFTKPGPLGSRNLSQLRIFRNALLANSKLRLHCRELILRNANEHDEDTEDMRAAKQQASLLLLDVARFCSATKLLIVHGDYTNEESTVWGLLRLALETMGNLVSLYIRPLHAYFSMGMFAIQMGSLPLPKELSTAGYLLQGHRKGPLIPSQMLGASTVKSLQINLDSGDAEILINMIQWPQVLEDLQFNQCCNLDILRKAPLIITYIARHASTLKTLRFGYLCEVPADGRPKDHLASVFDLSSFSALTNLHLSTVCHRGGSLGQFTDEVGRRLLPPNLEHITWFYDKDCHEGWWRPHEFMHPHYFEFEGGAFTEQVCQWLIDLCRWARDHCSRLRTITVFCMASYDVAQQSWYPFTYILSAKEEILEMGVVVEIAGFISYEKWQKQLMPDYDPDPYKYYERQDARGL